MTDPTLHKFFTPTTARSKRQRSNSSPGTPQDLTMAGERVGDLTQGQLFDGLERLLDAKLDSKLANLATKDDLRGISTQVTALREQNEQLQGEVTELKRQQSSLMGRILDLEGRSRRNNLIFKGMKVSDKTVDFRQVVGNFCSDMLGSSNTLWINRAHPLGRDRSTIIAHIPSDSDIDYIMRHTSKLKGTGYVVHRDFPREVRAKRAKLLAVRAEVERVAGKRRMTLIHDHLTIEGCRFTWQEGKLRAGQEDGATKLNRLIGRDFSTFLNALREVNPQPDTAGTGPPETSGTSRGADTQPTNGTNIAETGPQG